MDEERPRISWTEDGRRREARWLSVGRPAPPARVVPADDTLDADTAYRYACEGTAILWRGDFQNGRQLLDAVARRAGRSGRKASWSPGQGSSPAETFHRLRMARAQRAHILRMFVVEIESDYSIGLKRAPDAGRAILEALGHGHSRSVIPLREVLGMISASEWRRKGVEVSALGDRIHPHYGVFAPTRQEHVNLVAQAPLPSHTLAFDVGTGTGVLAAVLARRGVERIVCTDDEPRAVTCARENMERLGLDERVEVLEADLFPPGGYPDRAPLVICNPPWIPAKPTTLLERAVYDPKGRMLRKFLKGLAGHLTPSGEGWLVLSDLAEHLGLRTREELLERVEAAGLQVLDRLDARPTHAGLEDPDDPLTKFRRMETVSLWRLGPLPLHESGPKFRAMSAQWGDPAPRARGSATKPSDL